jgi:putative transposase
VTDAALPPAPCGAVEPVKQAVVLRLYPGAEQAGQMRQWIGAARALWNHLLGGQKFAADVGEKFFSLKELEAERQRWEAEPGFEWRKAAVSHVRQRIVRELDKGLSDFFKSLKGQRAGARVGFPRFKKKVPGGTFYVANTRFAFDVERERVTIDKLGEMRVRGGRMPTGRILGARVRHMAGHWYLAVQVEAPAPRVYGKPSESVIGVDVGLKAAVARSDGVITEASRHYRKAEKRLRRLQRRVSASQRGSRRAWRKRQAVARLHERIGNRRRDFLHTRSSRIVGKAAVIGIETLSIKGMARGRLAKSVGDAGMGELHRQIQYKAAWAGRTVVRADRFEPSSKTCSGCGTLHDMPLHRRVMRCECGLEIDRDVNAARNLARIAADRVGAVSAEPGRVAPTRGEIGEQVVTASPSSPVPVVEPRSRIGASRKGVGGRGPHISVRTRESKSARVSSRGPGP